MNQPIKDKVKGLKTSALGNRNMEFYDDALQDLDEAIRLLENERSAADPATSEEIDQQLGDIYGIKGGVLRRDNRLNDALEMYRRGLAYERPAGKASYNLTNTIALSVMLDGSSLAGLRSDIEQAIGLVDQQRQSNLNQWWPYADLGLLYLLAGQRDVALEQYETFKRKGAQVQDITTTVEVLERIRQSLTASGSPIAADISRAVEKLNSAGPA